MTGIARRTFVLSIGSSILAGCARFEPPHVLVDRYDSRTIRVACVGDSITYGAGVEDRDTKNFPTVLGGLLGSSFEVRNFGRSGATLAETGDLPYRSTEEFKAATAWNPDVVIIKLGTNDTKPQNWKGPEAFGQDLESLLGHFLGLKNSPKTQVWVCLPVPVYEARWGINSETLEDGVIPTLMKVCQKRRVPVIDLNDALTGHPEMFPDKIHPNAAGAKLMALTVFQAIRP